MEVPGKRETNEFCCKPCEENGLHTKARGYCTKCEEHMCTSCFDTHKKWKLNRDHTLNDRDEVDFAKGENASDFEKCDKHQDEPVKFYCAEHEQIGCGDCMIICHRSCKLDYIPDLANEMNVTSKFEYCTKGIGPCLEEAGCVLSSVKDNVVQVNDINEKFQQDVNMFRDEIMKIVNNMADRLLKEAECIKVDDSSKLTNLVSEIEGLMKDLKSMSDLFESKMENPSQLFVCSVSNKSKLDKFMTQLNEIKGRNKIDDYEFKRDINLLSALTRSTQLGTLQRDKEGTVLPVKRVEQKTVPQPLLGRQLVCRHIKVDGPILSYVDNRFVEVAMYVDKNRMEDGSYIEIEILSLGRKGTIAIGLVPDNYPANNQPGWQRNSIAYHADDGSLFHEYGLGRPFGPVCQVGDKIGCGTILNRKKSSVDVIAVFTRNGRKIGGIKLNTGPNVNLYPAVGMHSPCEKVKVILDAKMPLV